MSCLCNSTLKRVGFRLTFTSSNLTNARNIAQRQRYADVALAYMEEMS